ncbi:uncharacterized protein PV09_07296 [Verruconis gallopava]|uniref:J domain-containing protein n=1 Tax=Verruconis gallopava TaxID=253628 RepID=A0A0D2AQ11_9PEZI|nr:uncharacterized protein PV09_07296 [Verruconis gallopava]KIW01254.1 hypothetical protein PV09_07296 [Verruconis gallopava]
MDSPIPPDPYLALGVPKNADGDAIKKAYRKLALKLHPDKCTDESQKAARTDEFTKIQQAYDILGDDEKRRKYDAQVRLAELRRQNMELRSAAAASQRPDMRYNVRMSAPRETSYSTSRTAPPPQPKATYEQPSPRPRYYDDDYDATRGSTRKANFMDDYTYVKRPSPREEKREKMRVHVELRDEERRRDAKRRDAEVRESRSSKYTRDEYEEDRRRRDYDDMRRKTDAYESHSSSTERIIEERMRDAQRHMERQAAARPSISRRESTRQVPPYREPEVRRSAAPPKDKDRARETRRTSPSKDERRRTTEHADPYERRVPNLSSHSSAPPVVESMPPPPPRTYSSTNVESRKKAKDPSPPPTLSRSNTDTTGTASAGFSAAYHYGDERAAPHMSYSNGHRTVLREPTTYARRSESSPVQPSKGAVKMKGLDPKSVKRTAYSIAPGVGAIPVVEPASKSSSRPRVSERDRDYSYDRSRPQFFGEYGAGTVDPRYAHPSPEFDGATYHRQPSRPRDLERASYTQHSTYVY